MLGCTPRRENHGSRRKVEKKGLGDPPTPFPLSLPKGVMLPKAAAFLSQEREAPLQRMHPLKASISLQVNDNERNAGFLLQEGKRPHN